jgi:hydrogenase maturation protease
LDRLVDCDALVVVDAVRCNLQPGTVLSPTLEELPRQPVTVDFHAMGLPAMLELGGHLGLPMPRRVAIIGVAVAGDFMVSDTLSHDVERAIPLAVGRVLEELSCMSLP